MNQEIERKFLVTAMDWQKQASAGHILQGYLSLHPDRAVRVRIQEGSATLTLKGQQTSRIRHEFEYAIPVSDAEIVLEKLCLRPLIQKDRYQIDYKGHLWDIDVFAGENQGLVIAEVELDHPDESINLPPWVGKEVTDDPRYLNINLVRTPYQQWSNRVSRDGIQNEEAT